MTANLKTTRNRRFMKKWKPARPVKVPFLVIAEEIKVPDFGLMAMQAKTDKREGRTVHEFAHQPASKTCGYCGRTQAMMATYKASDGKVFNCCKDCHVPGKFIPPYFLRK